MRRWLALIAYALLIAACSTARDARIEAARHGVVSPDGVAGQDGLSVNVQRAVGDGRYVPACPSRRAGASTAAGLEVAAGFRSPPLARLPEGWRVGDRRYRVSSTDTCGRRTASATASWVIFPSRTLMPRRSASSSSTARRRPWLASARAYCSVALVSA